MCEVCKKIDTYIKKIKPMNRVIIAFDGVAPIAKLEQQRSRRFKSMFEIEINKECNISNSTLKWNKTAITPGTTFMDKLRNVGAKAFLKKGMTKFTKENISPFKMFSGITALSSLPLLFGQSQEEEEPNYYADASNIFDTSSRH